MKRTYAINARIDMAGELKAYLDEYIKAYNAVQRRVFHDLRHGIPGKMGMSRYISDICGKYGILKRTANSIRHDMQGRMKAYFALKKTELVQIDAKIRSVGKKVGRLSASVAKSRILARDNLLDKAKLRKYRQDKASLYFQRNRLNRLRQRRDALAKQTADKRVSLCFGSKGLLDAQNRLSENGFRSHAGWLNAFRKKRDSGIFLLGAGDESRGNQILQLTPCEDGFVMKLRKDKPYEFDGKYVFANISFPYMRDELAYALSNSQPITYRISRKGQRRYLTALFSMETDIRTDKHSGVIGIDYNNGFMEVVETDRSGNMADAMRVALPYHGTGNRAESDIKEKLSRLARSARSKGKDIAIEDLDFRKKKACQTKGGNKQYNRMLHLFDYRRYTFWLENLCAKYGVGLMKINPAYTSKIGKQKYVESRKLTVHRAAAFVIARRGQGFEDLLAV